jgi:hypothetical protein
MLDIFPIQQKRKADFPHCSIPDLLGDLIGYEIIGVRFVVTTGYIRVSVFPVRLVLWLFPHPLFSVAVFRVFYFLFVASLRFLKVPISL